MRPLAVERARWHFLFVRGFDDDMQPDGDWDYDLPEREALRGLVAGREALDRHECSLVDAARRLAIPWRSIAADLGVSTTTAYRRHASHDPIARRRPEAPGERR